MGLIHPARPGYWFRLVTGPGSRRVKYSAKVINITFTLFNNLEMQKLGRKEGVPGVVAWRRRWWWWRAWGCWLNEHFLLCLCLVFFSLVVCSLPALCVFVFSVSVLSFLCFFFLWSLSVCGFFSSFWSGLL